MKKGYGYEWLRNRLPYGFWKYLFTPQTYVHIEGGSPPSASVLQIVPPLKNVWNLGQICPRPWHFQKISYPQPRSVCRCTYVDRRPRADSDRIKYNYILDGKINITHSYTKEINHHLQILIDIVYFKTSFYLIIDSFQIRSKGLDRKWQIIWKMHFRCSHVHDTGKKS